MERPLIISVSPPAQRMLEGNYPFVVSHQLNPNLQPKVRVVVCGYVARTAMTALEMSQRLQNGGPCLAGERPGAVLAFPADDPRSEATPGQVIFVPDLIWQIKPTGFIVQQLPLP